jgi:hypothetical protein
LHGISDLIDGFLDHCFSFLISFEVLVSLTQIIEIVPDSSVPFFELLQFIASHGDVYGYVTLTHLFLNFLH